MSKRDAIFGTVIFVLVVMIFGAIGGIDQELMSVKKGLGAICTISAVAVTATIIYDQRSRRK